MNRIREQRKKLGVSMKKLAEELNVAESTLGYWERGEFEPSQEMLQKLAGIFECSVDYLIGRAELSFALSEKEKTVILAYRAHPDMQNAVDTLLEVHPDSDSGV